jgi:hypothetical protein
MVCPLATADFPTGSGKTYSGSRKIFGRLFVPPSDESSVFAANLINILANPFLQRQDMVSPILNDFNKPANQFCTWQHQGRIHAKLASERPFADCNAVRAAGVPPPAIEPHWTRRDKTTLRRAHRWPIGGRELLLAERAAAAAEKAAAAAEREQAERLARRPRACAESIEDLQTVHAHFLNIIDIDILTYT